MIALREKPELQSLGVKPKRCCKCKKFLLPDGKGWRDVPELLFVHPLNFTHTHCPSCAQQRRAAIDLVLTTY